jgi:hypothetical protein
MSRLGFLPVLLIAGSFSMLDAAPARAQFRNQGIELPNVGWLGLSTFDAAIHGGPIAGDVGWNIWDQPTIGLGWFFAIGYDLWLENTAALGASTTVLGRQANAPGDPVLTIAASTGLRYNFMSERLRPYVAMHVQYLQLLTVAGEGVTVDIPQNFFLNAPFFIGLRPGAGVEWIFGDEVSLKAELGVIGFLAPTNPDAPRELTQYSLGNLFLPAAIGRLTFNVYF